MPSKAKTLETMLLKADISGQKPTVLNTLARYADISLMGMATAGVVAKSIKETYQWSQNLPAHWGMNADSIGSKIVEYGPPLFALWCLYRIIPWSMEAANDFHKKHPSNGPFFNSYRFFQYDK